MTTIRPYQSLYIHVPFCQNKCAYCTFMSVPSPTHAMKRAYLEQVQRELETLAPHCTRPLKTIFIGGGTPTLLTIDELSFLFDAVRTQVSIDTTTECTIEANPETLHKETIAFLAATPVTRISIGVQSFITRLRTIIGRYGSPEHLDTIVDECTSAGIREINLDLIYDIPGQTYAEWKSDLRHALSLAITHLSAYSLTIEEGARLAHGTPPLPCDDETSMAMWQELSHMPLARYEISNYAMPGHECRHNLLFWRGGTYAGIGPSAVSFDGTKRIKNSDDITAWLNNTGCIHEPLTPESRARELMILMLRTTAGIDKKAFALTTGIDLATFCAQEQNELRSQDLINETPTHITPTERGLLFSNLIASTLIQ